MRFSNHSCMRNDNRAGPQVNDNRCTVASLLCREYVEPACKHLPSLSILLSLKGCTVQSMKDLCRVLLSSQFVHKTTGSGCSKITTSLVNVYVKILKVNIRNMPIFLLKHCEKCNSFSHFF